MNKYQRAAICNTATGDAINARLMRKIGLVSTARSFEHRVRKAADKLIATGAYHESEREAATSGA